MKYIYIVHYDYEEYDLFDTLENAIEFIKNNTDLFYPHIYKYELNMALKDKYYIPEEIESRVNIQCKD